MELKIQNITKRYRDKTAVDDVSITLTPGVWGLLGANGAGKTTLMRMLAGILRPSSGRILCDGVEIGTLGAAYREKLGYLPQEFGFYPEFTVNDYLEYVAALKGLTKRRMRLKIDELLQSLTLEEVRRKKISKLSGGMKRRVGIAQALLNEPEVLILDEPTNGLDPIGIYAIRQLLRGLSADFGKAVLISSHQLAEMEQLVDDIGILQQGVLLEESDYQALVKRNGQCIYLKVGQLEKAALVLEHMGIHQYVVEEDAICIWEMTHESAAINRALVKAGVDVSVIMPRQDTLEDYFKQITGGVGIA